MFHEHRIRESGHVQPHLSSNHADRAVIVTGAAPGSVAPPPSPSPKLERTFLEWDGARRPLRRTESQHPRIETFAVDLRDEDTPEAVVQAAIDRWDRLDVLVNNAGVTAVMQTRPLLS